VAFICLRKKAFALGVGAFFLRGGFEVSGVRSQVGLNFEAVFWKFGFFALSGFLM